KGAEGETITVYDGAMLYEKRNELKPSGENPSVPAEAGPLPSSSASATVHSEKMSVIQTGPRRFWERTYEDAGSAGGEIAGRETLLHQFKDKRPEGEISAQAWVDAET